MPASEPSWWYGRGASWQAILLSPAAALFAAIASRRISKARPYRSRLPVICVGNFTAGGSGKTPLAILVGKLVADAGREPWFLSRGYGGKLQGPVRVVAARHSASDVGDEPLLLARTFSTVVARERCAGAKAIEKMAPDDAVIIMDDGLQNPTLHKDLTIAAVDRSRGFGNGRVIPAGPLRAPLSVQAPLVQLIVLTGKRSNPESAILERIRLLTSAPIISSETKAEAGAIRFRGRKVLAFAGIANPERFFAMLGELGADVAEKRTFADHHQFTDAEARQLLETSERIGATLVTTEKDLARLSGEAGHCADLKRRSQALAIEMAIEGDGLEVLRSSVLQATAR
ncbi:MAG: tetraacyldisaccharide 4'-kinase [Hyphomicrobium sp.]|uniref:tetraacyldisaccharide 4'-kinase n=1 Tax=Hyphomicrobium sp. TaxID=82 RepID=UPI0039E2E2C5